MQTTTEPTTTETIMDHAERQRRWLRRSCWVGFVLALAAILFVFAHPLFVRWQLRQHGWYLGSMTHRDGLPEWTPQWAYPWLGRIEQAVIRREPLRINDLHALRQLSDLRYLRFESVDVSEEQLSAIANLSKTFQVDFLACRVEPAGLRHLAALPNLEPVHLTDMELTGSHLENLAECRQVSSLDLHRTTILGDGLQHLPQMTRLTRLELVDCRIADRDLEHVGNCGNLKHLRLTERHITDTGISALSRLSRLESLQLENCSVSDVGAKRIADGCPSLIGLTFIRLPMTDAALQELARLPGLRHMGIGDISITDIGLLKLKSCGTLKHLAIEKTAVTSAGVAELQTILPSVRISIE